jgi:hypothetical protein
MHAWLCAWLHTHHHYCCNADKAACARILVCAPLHGTVCLSCRLAVFHRLYQQAVALRQKMEMRRETVKQTEIDSIQQNKTNMSWISSDMMRDRSAGPFDNYGEMLYAESLESLARKRDKVRPKCRQLSHAVLLLCNRKLQQTQS